MTDEDAAGPGLSHIQEPLERTRAFGRQLVGLHVDDAGETATRAGYLFRVVRRDGESLIVTMDLRTNRVNVELEDDIVVAFSAG